ncbi:MAG: N-acetylmuramoyl-L-alanine amidase [Pseudomonadota bacterium]
MAERPENNETVWHIQQRLREKGFDIAIDGDLGPPTFWDQSETLQAVLAHLGGPVDVPAPLTETQDSDGKRIHIDIGHGPKPDRFDPGAVHKSANISEHSLNTIAAKACEARLLEAGFQVTIDDLSRHNYSAGKAAKGSDIFVSIHHNSHGAPAQGSEALFHREKGDTADRTLAETAAAEMAKELAIPDRGAKPAGLSVLSGAEDVGVPVSILAEMYFMHDQEPPNPPPQDMAVWSHRAGEALARAIIRYRKDNP